VETIMLADATLQTIIWTADTGAAARFYGDILGLTQLRTSHGALVYAVGAGELRVSPVPSTTPSPHTVLGFEVADVRAVARALKARGIEPERHPGFAHDADGVWRAPDGAQVVWFRDPDGNLLSAVRYSV
jgi:catechol 2,3-dioxygenase-like lactoylglutathione lyase family enzyme